MPNFHYTALNAKGEEDSGTLEAESEADAIQQLRRQNLYPTKVVEEGKGSAPKIKKSTRSGSRSKTKGKGKTSTKFTASAKARIKNKPLMIFTRQLATLIESGLPLLRGLTVLSKQEPNPIMKSMVVALGDSVQTGSTFSESLAQFPRIFSKLYVNMIKAGELGGVLELVLNRLAEYLEKAQKLKNKIMAAMMYPMIVGLIAVGIMTFLMVVIVPKFEKIFEDMLGSKDKLPDLTKAVIGFSAFIGEYIWFIIIGSLVIFFGWRAFGATKGGAKWIDNMKLKIPLFGDIQRKSAISRFSRTLGTLVTSGVPILQALNITRETAGNIIIAEAIGKVHDAVKEGESIAVPLESCKVFPPMVISMVDVGEETGQLPDMLLKIADVYDDEVDNAVAALTSMMEPIMIVFLAVVVGTIVMALFLPLIKIIEGVG